jgi:hypothetical protein
MVVYAETDVDVQTYLITYALIGHYFPLNSCSSNIIEILTVNCLKGVSSEVLKVWWNCCSSILCFFILYY